MIVEEFKHGIYVWFKDYQQLFLKECIDWLYSKFERFTLSSMDENLLSDSYIRRYFLLENKHNIKSFVCTYPPQTIPKSIIDIRKLSKNDRDLVDKFNDEKVTNRPTLQQLFNIFVEEGKGEIYALIDNDEILGYLSCAPAYLNI